MGIVPLQAFDSVSSLVLRNSLRLLRCGGSTGGSVRALSNWQPQTQQGAGQNQAGGYSQEPQLHGAAASTLGARPTDSNASSIRASSAAFFARAARSAAAAPEADWVLRATSLKSP